MPDPANHAPPRPPSRRWLVPAILLLVLALGAAAVLLLRHPAKPPARTVATPPPEAAPGATASVLAEPSVFPKDDHFQPPKVLTTRPVSYPEQALLNRIEGVVRVKFLIDETGHVINAIVDKPSVSVMLDAMALEYDLRKWTFQPAMFDGKPVPGTVDKEFEFRLDPKEQRALAEERLAAPLGTPDAPYPKAALTLKPQGSCTIAVTWTPEGRVDTINLAKSTGSNILDNAALRFAFVHWRVDPKTVTDKEFSKTMTFSPPLGPNDTPPPLTAPDADAAAPVATP